jgi:hypothetical protein
VLPTWAEARLQAATEQALAQWTDAVLNAARLTDVLGHRRPITDTCQASPHHDRRATPPAVVAFLASEAAGQAMSK